MDLLTEARTKCGAVCGKRPVLPSHDTEGSTVGGTGDTGKLTVTGRLSVESVLLWFVCVEMKHTCVCCYPSHLFDRCHNELTSAPPAVSHWTNFVSWKTIVSTKCFLTRWRKFHLNQIMDFIVKNLQTCQSGIDVLLCEFSHRRCSCASTAVTQTHYRLHVQQRLPDLYFSTSTSINVTFQIKSSTSCFHVENVKPRGSFKHCLWCCWRLIFSLTCFILMYVLFVMKLHPVFSVWSDCLSADYSSRDHPPCFLQPVIRLVLHLVLQ